MAKIKLPFELERPSDTEWAVDSSAVGYDATRSVRDVLSDIATKTDVVSINEKLDRIILMLPESIDDDTVDETIEEIFGEIGDGGDSGLGDDFGCGCDYSEITNDELNGIFGNIYS